MAPKRRAAAAASASTEESKKFKSAIDSMADEWLCPITTELIFEPVIAEDGNVYEKTAIEELIRVQGAGLKSPLTNLPMGPRLTPNNAARNTIEKLVRSGAVAGDKAERWLERLSDEEMVKKTRAKAEGGDIEAIRDMANWYYYGWHGLAEVDSKHRSWAEKGAALDDVRCLAQFAWCLVNGKGGPRHKEDGLVRMAEAAALGSARAAFDLGDYYWEGAYGLLQDRPRAKRWYAKVARATEDDLPELYCEEAASRAAGGSRG